MSSLKIVEVDGVFVVDSRLVAERLDIEHKSFLKTVRKYQALIEKRFGCIRFEVSYIEMPKGGTREEISHVYLTEDQATTIMTFSKNTETVIECKLDLVESFSKAKEVIKQFAASPAIPQDFEEALVVLLATVREKKQLAEVNQKLLVQNQQLELQAAKDAPKIDDYNRLINTDGWMCVREIHKCLAIPDPKFTQKSLNAFLRDPRVKILSKDTNQPYANWVAKGLAKMQPDRTPSGFAYNIPVFSYKGCIKILEALKNHGRIPVDHQCEFDFGFKVERPSAQYAIAGSRN